MGHGHNEKIGSVRRAGPDSIVVIEIPHDNPPAMKKDEDGERATAFWRIDANGKRVCWTRNGAVCNTGNRFRRTKLCKLHPHSLAELFWNKGMDRRHLESSEPFQIGLSLRVE